MVTAVPTTPPKEPNAEIVVFAFLEMLTEFEPASIARALIAPLEPLYK